MRIAILLIALTVGIGPARAQDVAETLQAANELASIISADAVNQISRGLTASFWPNLENSLKSKVDDATLSDLRADFEHLLAQFGAEAMKDAPAIYAKYFSAQELRDVTASAIDYMGAKNWQRLHTTN